MRELVNLGVEVHVAAPPGGPLIQQYRAEGIVVHPVQTSLPVRMPSQWSNTIKGFRDLVSYVKPDLIHSHFVGTTLTMRLALGKNHSIPRIFQVPGPLHLEHMFFRKVELVTAGQFDYWIGSCQWTCDRYRQSGVSPDRLFLSYYGTDIENFTSRERGRLRKELGLDASTKLVGMVAYMYPPKWYLGQKSGLKGHEDLIEAIAISLKIDSRIKGVFIGGAWDNAISYEKRVRARGKKLCGDNAVFLGTRHDVPVLYPDLDVAVHPSHSENVGGAVESLLLAVPTIATNVGGFPDVILHADTGWLIPARHPSCLATAILDVLRDPVRSREVALKGQALVRKLFDVRRTARQVLEIYETITS
jgi:glycosyltransferase involved in cell wall biosynthesis